MINIHAWTLCKACEWTCPSYWLSSSKQHMGFSKNRVIPWYPQFFEWLSNCHHSPIIQWQFFPVQVSTIFTHTKSSSMTHSLPKIRRKASRGLAIRCYLGPHCKAQKFPNKITRKIKEYHFNMLVYDGFSWFNRETYHHQPFHHQPLAINHRPFIINQYAYSSSTINHIHHQPL